MNAPERIQLKRTKGWKMPVNTIKVDRSTKWGNPWRIGQVLIPMNGPQQGKEITLDAKEAVSMLERSLLWKSPVARELRALIRTELRGKNLACWCKIGAPCHADVLLAVANAEEEERGKGRALA